MLTKLVIFKEKLKSIYAKGGAYIRYLLNFILAFSSIKCYSIVVHGGIGEVVNTPDCGSGMHGFEPHIPPHL